MISVGRKFLTELELNQRVELRLGDMTKFSDQIPEQIHAVSCVFALHHLPSYDALTSCIQEIARVRQRSGCAVWLFDFTRPRHPRTPYVFPEILTPETPLEFRIDTRNSLMASFSFEELCSVLTHSSIEPMQHRCARFMQLYQAHWVGEPTINGPGHHLWQSTELGQQAHKDFQLLRNLFPAVPLD